jgi:hypothetical protein
MIVLGEKSIENQRKEYGWIKTEQPKLPELVKRKSVGIGLAKSDRKFKKVSGYE